MVIFIGAQFGRTLSRFDGTAPHAILPLYASPITVASLKCPILYSKAQAINLQFPQNSCGKHRSEWEELGQAYSRFTSSWSAAEKALKPDRTICDGCRLVASNAGTSSSPVAFRPNRSSTQLCRAHSGRYSPKTSIPPNSNAQNRPPPFAENCASPAHNRRCSGKKTTIGDTTVPQSNQRSIAASRIRLPAPRRRPLVACATAATFPNERSAAPTRPIPPPKLKNRTVSPLVSRICKEVLWNLIFTATGPP